MMGHYDNEYRSIAVSICAYTSYSNEGLVKINVAR